MYILLQKTYIDTVGKSDFDNEI